MIAAIASFDMPAESGRATRGNVVEHPVLRRGNSTTAGLFEVLAVGSNDVCDLKPSASQGHCVDQLEGSSISRGLCVSKSPFFDTCV